ncbi:MAG: hypothetical protein ACI9C1_001036, partial [Candidatus Aldehydirespiratoraceae bacterium]
MTDHMSKGLAVIDGSNLATEGRSEPDLAQLNEAVATIAAEYDFAEIVVIVDATFEHRVAKSETKAARQAVDDGKIITPPAGVIGRGDAFILQVADRADAVVFSNDSFQEFHAIYDWLFDEGRLIGGKPIPSVGWIYVARSPVRGPVSRRVTADKRRKESPKQTESDETESDTTESDRAHSKAAGRKQAAPKQTNRKKAESNKPDSKLAAEKQADGEAAAPSRSSRRRGARKSAATATASVATGDGSNDPSAWKEFEADYPVGSTIAAKVERFASHGAYGSVGDIVVYLPNRLLGNPPPTKARDVVDLGQTMDFVVHRYDAERFGIDAGLIPAKRTQHRKNNQMAKKTSKKAAAKKKAPAKKAPAKKAPAKKAPAKKAPAKKAPA